MQTTGEFMTWGYNPYTPFGPVVEKHGNSSFISKSPIEIITSGEVQDLPWITGVVSEEGLYPAADFVGDQVKLKELDENWDKIAPFLLDYNYTIPLNQQARISQMIRKHYLGSKPIDRSTIGPLIQMIGDRSFVTGGVKAAKSMAKANRNPVRFYYFGYRGANSGSDAMSRSRENFGVAHGDDVYYVVGSPLIDPTSTPKDRAMQRFLLNLWVSFATTGIPQVGIEWPALNQSEPGLKYLYIKGPGECVVEHRDNFGQSKFWESIEFDENRLAAKIVQLG